ncbi:MAG: UDP-glucose/GDP-mannose dehydrogenase family protein [Nanoarchaeota archaeon]
MNITFFGTGYVGLVSGTCFAELGNNVICIDIDQQKIEKLNNGISPFYEPGLSDLMVRNHKEGRLSFTTDAKHAIDQSEIIFIAVGTPQKQDGDADLSFVFDVAKTLGETIKEYKIIVIKSTVPVGTAEKVQRLINQHIKGKAEYDVVSNPEFLREGQAIYDFMHSDKIVIGSRSQKAIQAMKNLYKPLERINQPIVTTTNINAELMKYANNAFLATKISFMNELASLCEEIGADIKEIAVGIGLDKRIGPRFLQAGIGYGGSCFPKDVRALMHSMEKQNLPTNIMRAVDYVNERQKKSLLPKLKTYLPELEGKRIAIWGLSYKPKTDDIREAPALVLISQLLDSYAEVVVFDPEAMENTKKIFPKIEYATNPYEAIKDADALIICTEWDEFRQLDMKRVKEEMRQAIIIDGRNIYTPAEMISLGFKYKSIGRT